MKVYAVLLVVALSRATMADEATISPDPFSIAAGYEGQARSLTRARGETLFLGSCDFDGGTSIGAIKDGSDKGIEVACGADGGSYASFFVDGARVLLLPTQPESVPDADSESLWEVVREDDDSRTLKTLLKSSLSVSQVTRFGNRLLIGTSGNGLKALTDGNSIADQIGGVPSDAHVRFISLSEDRAYVGLSGLEGGVWTLSANQTTASRFGDVDTFRDTTCIQQIGERTFIGGEGKWGVLETPNSTFPRLFDDEHPDDGIQPYNHQADLTVNCITAFGQDVLFGTNYGVWRLAPGAEEPSVLEGPPVTANVDQIVVAEGPALIAAGADGLWTYTSGESLQRVGAVTCGDSVLSIVAADGRYLVSTSDQAGRRARIMQLRFVPNGQEWPLNAKLNWQVPSAKPIAPYTARVHLEVEDSPGWVDASMVDLTLSLYKEDGEASVFIAQHHQLGTADASFDLQEAGSYYATAKARSALAQVSEVRSEKIAGQDLQVYPNQATVLLGAVKNGALAIGAVWALATLGLVYASRRSPLAFQVVTSPAIPRLAQWYAPLFEFLRPVRLWMLERAYQRLKIEYAVEQPFVDPTVTKPGGEAPALAALIGCFQEKTARGEDAKRVTLIGPAGSGKSTLIDAFLAKVASLPTLRESWQEFGVLPIVIRVRDHGSGSLLATVATNLERFGIDDERLVKRLLRSGDFLLIVDGANEANWDDAIKTFAVNFPETPIIVTSQNDLGLGDSERWGLPTFDSAFARKVLAAHLPESRNHETQKVSDSLWVELRSGYDVVLLVELLKGDTIPDRKVGLYESTIERSGRLWTGTPPFLELRASLYRKAFELWVKSSYELEPSDTLPAPFVAHLGGMHVLSRTGARFQFRHELMRQYLAACWLIRESASVTDLVTRLGESETWSLGSSQQREVFAFLTQLLLQQADLQTVADYAAQNIAQRAVLAAAIQEEARIRHWAINLKL